ncbi:hypothetical protein F4677DRAFT_373821 [Hypoxylon crocopeplum]|nr:hypothetical protein F4677DRAFT_373821 [Hypoxylon crocopeplum]
MSELILITGATGFIGFHVLTRALDAGYRVRAAVRSPEKADSLLSIPALKDRNIAPERLSFVTVPDLTKPGAYDDAVQGANYIIHVASPLPSGALTPAQYEAQMIAPAVQGTLGILASAQKAPSVKRVVITSSVAAILPFGDLAGGSSRVFDAESRAPTPDTTALAHPFQAYAASKTKSFNEAEAWVRRERPAFDVVNVHPSFVMGRDDVHPTPSKLRSVGTNQYILGVALGVAADAPVPGSTAHVDDVARVHVDALRADVPGNTSYVVHSNNPTGSLNGTDWADVVGIVARHFPDAVARGVLPNNGHLPRIPAKIDASKTEKTFGFTHLSFEQQVKDVVEQYLSLVESS